MPRLQMFYGGSAILSGVLLFALDYVFKVVSVAKALHTELVCPPGQESVCLLSRIITMIASFEAKVR